jgi:Flp pilus assembly pilin Flp
MRALLFIFQTVGRLARKGRRGQTLVEYTLILAVICIVCIGVLTALGNKVVYVFSSITSLLDTAQASH